MARAAVADPPPLYASPSLCEVQRAGYPLELSPLARFAYMCEYTGYYVGGGGKSNANVRAIDQGTWGWDYIGHCRRPLVRLDFRHPAPYQGGEGQYEPDGPKCRN
jgi:hypothetical protein